MLQSSDLRQTKVTNEDIRLNLLDSLDLKLESKTVALKEICLLNLFLMVHIETSKNLDLQLY